MKVAVTVVAAVTVTAQVPVPVQPPPLQPVKVEPTVGDAVNVTAVPWPNVAEQVAPQLTPLGDEVDLPRRGGLTARGGGQCQSGHGAPGGC